MKIIDLLNKIAKREEVPKMFKYNDKIWRLASNRTYFIGSDYGYDFWVEHGNDKFEDEIITLNDEIEILEDKPKEEKKIPDEININLAYIDKEYLLDKEDVDRKINEIINRHNILVDKVSDYFKSKEGK